MDKLHLYPDAEGGVENDDEHRPVGSTLPSGGGSRPLPVPEEFLSTSSPSASTRQEGRFRVIVFLGCPNPSSEPTFARFVDRLSARARLSLVGAAYKPALNPVPHKLHVSLSRAWDVNTDQVQTLLSALRKALMGAQGGQFILSDALLALPGGRDEGELTYFAAPIAEANADAVIKLIRLVDKGVAEVGIPRFYANARPHMSFLRAEGFDVLESCASDGKLFRDLTTSFECCYDAVYCTVGCQTYKIALV